MRNTMAIAWKEIRAYFTSPVAYVVALIFVALAGYFLSLIHISEPTRPY